MDCEPLASNQFKKLSGFAAWCEVDVLRIRWMVVICARKVKSVKFLDTFLHFLRATMEKRVQTYCCRKLFFLPL